jgi:hypothetical protein
MKLNDLPTPLLLFASLLILSAPRAAEPGQPTEPRRTQVIRVYSHLLDPREHPDYDRRAVKPPSWDTFGHRTQFTTLRGFNVQNDQIVGYAEEIEKFTRTHELGDVLWPSYPILFAKNLGDLADEIKRRSLYLFDVWGYVPGSGPGGYWQQFKPPAEAFATLESKLGERWFGTDIGEQDGRYIGGYANQMTPASASRFEQYLNFQRHFERMGDDLGHKHATLVSLNFGHYFLKEGTYTLIGAETAQALPNNQVYYAFIRGAGKQYGVPWFGNASIFNRWGYKVYGSSGRSEGYDYGPTRGTSLSLMKRLLYSHILYNSVAVGFENGWFDGDKLSPIGQIQQAAQRWVQKNGQPGVMHTPVAILLDFYSGWSFPRHLYTDKVYRVWGNLPYGPGDYLTDGILDLLYPGYQNSSYYHDESGFISPTPYGDIADCLLSDAPLWLLERYAVVIIAGELSGGLEIRDKLQTYAERGGHVVITAGNLAKLPGGLAGRRNVTENAIVTCGSGRVTFFASPYGATLDPSPTPPWSETDKPLAKPYALDSGVRHGLNEILRQQELFELHDQGLSCIICRKGPGKYTLGVLNNTWHELPLKIASHCGPIESLRELPLDHSEQGAAGYLPEGVDASAPGKSTERTIAGGDARIFAVKVAESGVEEVPKAIQVFHEKDLVLPLRRAISIKEEILARPTFFEHFAGVVVNYRYLHEREQAALRAESTWLHRQGVRVFVDLSPGVNLYPTLRLIDNLHAEYETSKAAIADVLAKMEVLGARDLVVSLHRHPENNFTDEQTRAAFDQTLKTLCAQAADRKTTLHLRMAFGKPPWNLEEAARLLERVKAPNLKLAPSTALLLVSPVRPDTTAELLRDRVGLWLVSGPRQDIAGQLYDVHGAIQLAGEPESLAKWLRLAPEAPVLLDANYTNQDEEYLDVVALERLGRGAP